MQVELWSFLDGSSTDADKVKSAQKTLKQFTALLKEVDWQVMGGEDVLQSMKMIPTEVSAKLKKKTPAKKRLVAMKKTAKKPVAKKSAAKKKKVTTRKKK